MDSSLSLGYPLTKYTIRPFADYDLTNDPDESAARQAWNAELSSVRITVEHAFGRLKGRFPYLRRIPGHDIDKIYHIMEALLVIHNILIDLHDDPTQIENFNGEEDPGVVEWRNEREVRGRERGQGLSSSDLYRTGLIRRKWLLDLRNRN